MPQDFHECDQIGVFRHFGERRDDGLQEASTLAGKLANRSRAYLTELANCVRVGARWPDAFRLMAATLAFHADKSGSGNSRSSAAFGIRGRRGEYLVRLRPRTGDFFIFHEIFTFMAYELPPPMLAGRRIRTVLDLGANVGLASLYFHDVLAPDLMVAVEPVESNFEMLHGTLAPLGRSVICERAAVGRTSGKARILDAAAPTWGAKFSSAQADDGTVVQRTIPELMRIHGMERIGLLKMDIEGAEEEIFAGDFSWLDKVDIVLVELHTALAVARFDAAAAAHGFRRIAAPSGQCVMAAGPQVNWI